VPIEFSASGSEYFRIWIVNLLLTLVTLGLYYPWARVRKLRYFYGNTRVGGHAFDFHGEPKRMLRGFLLVGALAVLYSLAGRVSPTAGLIALVIIAAVWPALFRASMQFRLANTSWRGLRFRFTGSTADAYRAMLPMFVAGIAFAGVAPLMGDESGRMSPSAGIAFGVMALVVALSMPWAFWLLKKYQHGNYALGEERTSLRAGVGSFYGLSLKVGGLAMLMGLALGFAVAAITAGFGRSPSAGSFFTLGLMVAVFYVLFFAVIGSYSSSRSQNLVWNQTASARLRFTSNLRFNALLGLTLKNWLLVALTLGLYWPFAKVAVARLRLESAGLVSSVPLDLLGGGARARADDASGDAAGELFGIDIGL
jgi:uncharacterized membrane protein YjgN (DUF898 family)